MAQIHVIYDTAGRISVDTRGRLFKGVYTASLNVNDLVFEDEAEIERVAHDLAKLLLASCGGTPPPAPDDTAPPDNT